ncbi:MAG: NHL repeat-containing protein [Calditrichaceae bacterium]|nr:NHL repeat-containing protein [Calditrichaceae bacterium]MBN2708713.1 NHL repeat-containing protein [Calditrichaceae bacterium]RQV92825.1 MAG: hypothetical protein EH224_14365 [Calditrichota bacterium]
MKYAFIVIFIFFTNAFAQTIIENARFGEQGQQPGQFSNPNALSISPDGTLYIVDTGNSRIQLFTLKGRFIRSVGGFGFKNDQFDKPYDIWTRSVLNFYIADYENQRVVRYDKNMNFISALESTESGNPDFIFREISSVAVNSQNELFLLEHGENKIIKYDRNGNAERIFGAYQSGTGSLVEPHQLEIQGIDKIIISDRGKKALIVFDFFGNYIKHIQSEEFVAPAGLAVDQQFRVYVADPGAAAVFRIDPALTEITKLDLKLDIPLKAPADLAVWKEPGQEQKTYKVYILDGHELIIGNLMDE